MPRTVHSKGQGGFAVLVDQAHEAAWRATPVMAASGGRPSTLWMPRACSASRGTAWHAVANEGDAVGEIAAVIGRRLGLPVGSVPEETFGPFASIFAMD